MYRWTAHFTSVTTRVAFTGHCFPPPAPPRLLLWLNSFSLSSYAYSSVRPAAPTQLQVSRSCAHKSRLNRSIRIGLRPLRKTLLSTQPHNLTSPSLTTPRCPPLLRIPAELSSDDIALAPAVVAMIQIATFCANALTRPHTHIPRGARRGRRG